MKRLILAVAFACALSATAIAGEIPTTGVTSAGEIPTTGVTAPQPTSNSLVVTAILTIINIIA